MTYVAGTLEHDGPFLAPLHKLMAMHPRRSLRIVPPKAVFFQRFLSSQVQKTKHISCAEQKVRVSTVACGEVWPFFCAIWSC